MVILAVSAVSVVPLLLLAIVATGALDGCLFNNGCYTDCAPPPEPYNPVPPCPVLKRQCSQDNRQINACDDDGGWRAAETCGEGSWCLNMNGNVACVIVSDASLAGDGAEADR